ncbi:MAG: DUF1996 domain-containing protein [Planctomycetota bacterium]
MKLYAAVGVALLLAVGVVTYALVRGDNETTAATDGTDDLMAVEDDVAVSELATGLGEPLSGDVELPVGGVAEPSLVPVAPGPPTTASPGASGEADDAVNPTGSDAATDEGSAATPGDTGPATAGATPAPGDTPTSGTPTGTGTGDPSGTGSGTPAPNGQAGPRPEATVFAPLRNDAPAFSQYASVPSADLPVGQLTGGAFGSPTPNPISGQFRMHCEYSHFAYDDPIVFPGQPGQSHLHLFFGNTGADAYSTTDSMLNTGGGSCNGYELDRSGYWIPALMNGTTQTIVPDEILLYYKTNHPSTVQTFPEGLRVIAGASPDDPNGANHYRWKCENKIGGGAFQAINFGPFYETIPDCRALGYETLGFILDFPYCWDGVNVDSADHRSHMSYSCGASHPVIFPQLQYIIHYPAPPAGTNLHLSSDSLECQTGAVTACGDTLHGDFWNAWHEGTNQTWIEECSRKRVVCGVPNISAGTRLVGPPLYSGPNYLDLPSGSYVPGRD